MPIVVVGLSHHTSAVDLRERFAFPEAAIPGVIEELRGKRLAEEAVILSTCNRVELYAVVPSADPEALGALRRFLMNSRGLEGDATDALYCRAEPQSVEHLFRVASGMDSMVLGETEILGQIKRAYELALSHKFTGGRLNRAFQRAFHVAKHIRTETNIQRGSVSVGSVAVELAEKIFSALNDRDVMVIGAGDTSEKTARALISRGARSILVANRSFDRAAALAVELGGRAVSFDSWEAEFEHIDIVISSTAAPHYVLDRPKLERLMPLRRHRSLLLIDIAVPRDIDPDVQRIDNVFLYNIDDLQSIASDYQQQRREELARCEQIILDKARALLGPAPIPPSRPRQEPAFGHE